MSKLYAAMTPRERLLHNAFSCLAGDPLREARGHRATFAPNKASEGFRLLCSCGWQYRARGPMNRSGRDYAKDAARQAFNDHLPAVRR